MTPLYIGISAGFFTALAMLPQLIKIIKTKEAQEISVKTYIILLSGLILWVIYGIVQKDFPVIITNAFSCIVNLLIVIFSLKYRGK